MSIKTCYDCHLPVTDLRSHRLSCQNPRGGRGGRGARGGRGRGRGGGFSQTRQVECYDCHEQVTDLHAHRSVCKNGRRQKTAVVPEFSQENFPGLPAHSNLANTVDYYGLIDTSASMSGTRIENAKLVLTDVVTRLPDSDRIAIITFDSKPFFRLKPRPVGQIRRQNELPALLSRFLTQGATAIWDAIWMAVEQLRDKSRKTVINVLTDGEDNSSTHSFQEVSDLVAKYPNITLNITHISDVPNEQYVNLCSKRGVYRNVKDVEMRVTFSLLFKC